MLADPAAAAWNAAGEPTPEGACIPGRCGRCGSHGNAVASLSVVSVKFTGFADWPFGADQLCSACAWAYSRPPARVPAMHITCGGVAEYSDRGSLTEILRAGALSPHEAVVLPTTRHRHVLATAEWGHLAVDGLVCRWDAIAAGRLEDLVWLREDVGATWRQLQRPVPPAELLGGQARALWPRALQAWSQLDRWRATPPLWAAARILTNDYTRRTAALATPAGTVR